DIVRLDGKDCIIDISGHEVRVPNPDAFGVGKACKLVIRPEATILSDEGALPCKVVLSCFMGAYQNYHVMVGDTLVKLADYCPVGRKVYEVGDTAYLSFRDGCVHIL
ncbi:MAG: TOBE domain-containing protein, partial [Clostridia bacterium]|nr:TOBE domain-containing protein [Clostridia bacterium]